MGPCFIFLAGLKLKQGPPTSSSQVYNRRAQPFLAGETFYHVMLLANTLFCLRQGLLKINFVCDLCVGIQIEVGVGPFTFMWVLSINSFY